MDFTRGMKDVAPDLDEVMGILGLEEFYEESLYGLSSGQEQLVMLLAALSRDMGLVIADEAFTHIDISRSGRIISYMQRIKRDLIFSTHVPEEAETLADYIVILDSGRTVWSGTVTDLFASDIFEVYLSSAESVQMECLFRYGGICLVRSSPEYLSALMSEGKILGFRKSGARRIYGQSGRLS